MFEWSMQRQREIKGFRKFSRLYICLLFHSTCFSKMQSPFHHCFFFFPFSMESQSIPTLLKSSQIAYIGKYSIVHFISVIVSSSPLQQKGAQVWVSLLDYFSHKTGIKVQLLFQTNCELAYYSSASCILFSVYKVFLWYKMGDLKKNISICFLLLVKQNILVQNSKVCQLFINIVQLCCSFPPEEI